MKDRDVGVVKMILKTPQSKMSDFPHENRPSGGRAGEARFALKTGEPQTEGPKRALSASYVPFEATLAQPGDYCIRLSSLRVHDGGPNVVESR